MFDKSSIINKIHFTIRFTFTDWHLAYPAMLCTVPDLVSYQCVALAAGVLDRGGVHQVGQLAVNWNL